MFDYLQKFNSLPRILRDKVSSPSAMRTISALENKYKVDLAALVMKVMAKVLAIKDLNDYLVNELDLTKELAEALKQEIIEDILAPVSDYLEISGPKKSPEISEFSATLMKDSGISLPSEDLYLRLRNIMLTYLKGVRSKIDAKNSLMKKVEFGGLGLSDEEADKVFKLVNLGSLEKKEEIKKQSFQENFQSPEKIVQEIDKKENLNLPKKIDLKTFLFEDSSRDEIKVVSEIKKTEPSSKEKLDRIIMSAETSSLPLYDLKKSLAEKPKQVLLAPEEKELALPLENKDKAQDQDQAKVDMQAQGEMGAQNEIELELKKVVDIPKEKIDLDTIKKPKVEAIKEVSELKTEEAKNGTQEEYLAPQILNLNFKRPAPTSYSKPKIEDIKPVAKAMSPIDELRFLDLTNFRRLSDNSDEAVLKIFNKIKLLERDGYDKMVEGVKAWRQNEVNRLYVKIGQESLLKASSLKDAIVERQKRNMPFLKIEEINSISNLNRRLTF